MGQITEFPDLDALEYIRTIAKTDSYLKAQFSFTDKDGNELFRVYDSPLDTIQLKPGYSFSAWWQGELDYDKSLDKHIPYFYIDIATQEKDIPTAINNTYKLMRSVRETLRLESNLNGNVQEHWPGDIKPLEPKQNSMWTFFLTMEYRVIPNGRTLY